MKAKLLLCLITTVLSAGVGLLALSTMGIDHHAIAASLKTRSPQPHIFQNDDLLGWRVAPNIVREHIDGSLGTTESNGRRVTPDSNGSPVLLLGCSFTWGANVEDHETFAWLCGEARHDLKVINVGCPAYGPTQAYLILKRELDFGKTFGKVVYCFFDHHVLRTTLNDQWQGYGNRWFPTVDGDLQPHLDRHTQRERRDYLQDTDPAAHTLKIIRGMADLCEQHGQEFLIARLPCPDFSLRGDAPLPIIWPEIERIAPTLDLSDTPGGWYSYHPDAEMHANIAARLAEEL